MTAKDEEYDSFDDEVTSGPSVFIQTQRASADGPPRFKMRRFNDEEEQLPPPPIFAPLSPSSQLVMVCKLQHERRKNALLHTQCDELVKRLENVENERKTEMKTVRSKYENDVRVLQLAVNELRFERSHLNATIAAESSTQHQNPEVPPSEKSAFRSSPAIFFKKIGKGLQPVPLPSAVSPKASNANDSLTTPIHPSHISFNRTRSMPSPKSPQVREAATVSQQTSPNKDQPSNIFDYLLNAKSPTKKRPRTKDKQVQYDDAEDEAVLKEMPSLERPEAKILLGLGELNLPVDEISRRLLPPNHSVYGKVRKKDGHTQKFFDAYKKEHDPYRDELFEDY